MTETAYHIPALLREAVEMLDIKPGGVYVDATFGGGGHSRAIMAELNEAGRLYGFDRDRDAIANSLDDPRFIFVHSNFRYISNFLRYHGEEKVDGIIADLGVSFHHFDTAERGFSFRNDAPLDMRMTRDSDRTAASIIANSDEQGILKILKSYADLKSPGKVAAAIFKGKDDGEIATTFQLADVVRGALDPRQEKKEMAQVFQAFRIAVNGEAEDLQLFLEATLKVLKPKGRLAVLTYHSMEDRMVKNFMKTGNIEGLAEKDFFGNLSTPWHLITKKPIEPSEEEILRNPRSRSAKLRVASLK